MVKSLLFLFVSIYFFYRNEEKIYEQFANWTTLTNKNTLLFFMSFYDVNMYNKQ